MNNYSSITSNDSILFTVGDLVSSGKQDAHKKLCFEIDRYVDFDLAYDLALLSIRRMYL